MKEAPNPTKKPKELTIHGHTRLDNYYWMNDREDPEVLKHLEEENAYVEALLEHTKDFQEKLFQEITGRITPTDLSVPYKLDDYYYYSKYDEGKEQPVYCRKRGNMEANEEVILDVNQLAEGLDFIQVVGLKISFDQNILAYGVDTTGRRQYEIRFRDLETGKELEDRIPNTTGGIAWANDNKTLFFTRKDDSLRPYKIFRFRLGQSLEESEEVWHEEDDTYITYVHRTKSKKFIVITSYSTNSYEARILPADQPGGDFKVFHPREKTHEYTVFHYGEKFYILTNWEAKNFRLMECPEDKTEKSNWKEVIPHREDVLLENVEIFQDYLVLEERENGLTRLRIIPWNDREEHYVSFQDPTYSVSLSTNPQFDTGILRFEYNSLTTPRSIYDYNMDSRERELLKQQKVLGEFNPEDYVSERIWATAKDGVKVPVSLVYKKGFRRDGSQPFYLTGYGSYGHSYDPYFSSMRLSLLDRGFGFGIAHIRGGQEMGRKWYEDGRMLKKMNTFTDFIACSEALIEQGFSHPEKLVVQGGSAGGMLMGGIMNMRPDLYKAVVADVPFVDVVTTMLDESIPLTTGEFTEWGNPKEKQYYDYMLSYSPYDNVEAKAYPNVFIYSGFTDSQVQYWEPTKWAARLRDLKTDDHPVLLYTELSAGHSGKSGRFERFRIYAMKFAYIFDLLGIKS